MGVLEGLLNVQQLGGCILQPFLTEHRPRKEGSSRSALLQITVRLCQILRCVRMLPTRPKTASRFDQLCGVFTALHTTHIDFDSRIQSLCLLGQTFTETG